MSGWFSDLAEQAIGWLVTTAADMIVLLIDWILASPDGALSAPAMTAMIGQGVTVGRYLLPLMLMLGVIQAASANRPGAIARLVFVDMPLVAAAMLVIAPVTGVLLAFTDALTGWVVSESALTGLRSAFASLPTATFLAGRMVPVVGVLSLIALIGAMLVWAMMLMRGLGVSLSVVIGPAMIATRLWPAAAPWAARWLALLVAFILVKPVIGFMLSLSVVMLGAGIDPAAGFVDVQALAMGLMAFVASALVPSFLFKFIPQVGEAVQGRLSSGLAGTALTAAGLGASAVFAAGNLAGAGAVQAGSMPAGAAPVGMSRAAQHSPSTGAGGR